MTEITLKANESKILAAAAANGGRISLPTRLKEVTRQRLAGLFVEHALAETVGDTLQLTRAGYRAVGLRPPRQPRAAAVTTETGEAQVSTRDRARTLLERAEGASLPELMAATGWLPHTTRAALSRIRSGGEALGKGKREDGATCYRLLPHEAVAPLRLAREHRGAAAAEIAA